VGGVVINIKWKEFECREHLSQTASVRRPVRASERQSVRDYITDLTDKHKVQMVFDLSGRRANNRLDRYVNK
jgi:hypothetical protein